MEAVINSPVKIEKEEVARLSFPAEEVLLSPNQSLDRRIALELATRLGNSHKGKVKIVFEDKNGLKEVQTTVWATTEKNIILKRGVCIPIHRIHSIKIF